MPSGQDILDLAATRIGQEYVLGILVPKNDSHWDGPWDCAEFVSWLVYQVSGTLYGVLDDHITPALADAYTGAWGRDSRVKGQEISIDDAAKTVGAAILRLGPVTGHIVVSDGKGGTIEAHSSSTGVIRGSLSDRRWTMGILVPGIDYPKHGDGNVGTSPPMIFRLKSPYMKHYFIITIQEALKRKGFDSGNADGIFGPKTEFALRSYQASKGLVPDGEFGPESARSLGILTKYLAIVGE